jgi:L-aspartate oxidase
MDFDHTRLSSRGFADPADALGAGDIVVIGAGLAGLFTALRLAPLPVTVVAAAPLGEGASSVWAQGGIAAAVGEGDTPERHAADTIAAGDGIVDAHVANVVAAEAPQRIADLLRYGVPFDRDLAGHFVLSREAAHSEPRVVRVSGDRAGAAIMQSLIAAVKATPSIRVLEGYEALDLISDAGTGNADRISGVRLVRAEASGASTFDFMPQAP